MTVLVRGSSGNTYHVDLIEDNGIARLHCSCKAGEMGDYCKHMESILNGDTALLESEEEINNFYKLQSIIEITDLKNKARNLNELKQEYESLGRKIKRAKDQIKSSLKVGFNITRAINKPVGGSSYEK